MVDLIDTHQHLVYPGTLGYGWTDGIPALANKAFTVDDYRGLTSGSGIVGSLFMETAVDDADYQREAAHVAAIAKEDNSGILGLIVSARPESDEGFSDWLEAAKAMGAVGIRRVLHVVADDMSSSGTFRANVRKIGAADLVFDMCFLARQLPLAAELAQACPETRFVLDHCGVPDIAAGEIDRWKRDITAVASHENVVCKLSGLLAYCAPGSAGSEAIRPYVDHVLEVFGPSRMVWGSDWPVVDLGGGLPLWLEVTRTILGELSGDEANAIGSGTAKSVYRV